MPNIWGDPACCERLLAKVKTRAPTMAAGSGARKIASDQHHEADESQQAQGHDAQLEGQEGIGAEQAEGRVDQLPEEERIGVPEDALGGVEEGRAPPGLGPFEHQVPVLVEVDDQPGVAAVAHDPFEAAGPLGVEEDQRSRAASCPGPPRPLATGDGLTLSACHRRPPQDRDRTGSTRRWSVGLTSPWARCELSTPRGPGPVHDDRPHQVLSNGDVGDGHPLLGHVQLTDLAIVGTGRRSLGDAPYVLVSASTGRPCPGRGPW